MSASGSVKDLLEQHLAHVYRFALRLARDPDTAEDLTQETMLRAWEHRRRLHDHATARSWLLRITANQWRDLLRRRRVRSRPDPTRLTPRGAPPPADRAAAQREEVASVLALLDDLPDRQREALYLSACEQLTIAQIAEILGISRNAAKASLSLARQRVRERLEREVKPSEQDRSNAR